MNHDQENLQRLIELIHDESNVTVVLPNKYFAVSSEDGKRGLVLFDLRDPEQRRVYDDLKFLEEKINGSR